MPDTNFRNKTKEHCPQRAPQAGERHSDHAADAGAPRFAQKREYRAKNANGGKSRVQNEKAPVQILPTPKRNIDGQPRDGHGRRSTDDTQVKRGG